MPIPMIISISTLCIYALCIMTTLSLEKMRQCRRKNRLITERKSDMYELVDAMDSQEIMIQCHFCEENDDHNPKIWYKQVRPFKKQPEELKWNITLDPLLQRTFVNPEHTLIIKNYSANQDEGLYYCHGKNGEETENKYNYLIDTVVNVSGTAAEVGDAVGWRKYHEKYLEPINKILEEKNKEYRENIMDDHLYQLEALTEWGQWGNCVVCGMSEGQRRRKGICRFKGMLQRRSSSTKVRDVRELLTQRRSNGEVVADIDTNINATDDESILTNKSTPDDETYRNELDRMFRVTPIYSCRSALILKSDVIPAFVTDALGKIPDYIQVEKCHDVCKKGGAPSKLQFDLGGRDAHSSKDSAEDERAQEVMKEAEKEEEEENLAGGGAGFQMMELQYGDKLILVCPGASASSVVTWKLNGKMFGVGGGKEFGPVDALGTLHIDEVGAKDAGSYACAVDGVDSTVVGVTVELPPYIKAAEFLRHSVYLGVVMGICLTIYCSGLVVAYTQKHRFQPPGYSKVEATDEGDPETEIPSN